MATGIWRVTTVRVKAPSGATGTWLTTRVAVTRSSTAPATGVWRTTRVAVIGTRSTTGTWRTTRVSVATDSSHALPTADAGSAQDVNCAELVTLDGRASTVVNGTLSTYTWRIVSASGAPPTLSSTSVSQPTFRAPISATGQTIVFGLIVRDSTGNNSPEDTVAVSIAPAPLAVPSGGVLQPAGLLCPNSSGVLV